MDSASGQRGRRRRGDAHVDVLAAFVDGCKGGQQAGPGGGAAVADLVAVEVPLGIELVVQAGHRVRGGVQVGGDRQQPLLFRVEQEYQAHHHSERAPVHLAWCDLAEQGAPGLTVEPGQLTDEQLGSLPDLHAQGGGDFGLGLGTASKQSRQAGAVCAVGVLRRRQHPACGEQASESAQQVAFLKPQISIEHRRGGWLAGFGMHQCPQGAVGEQGQRDTSVTAQLGGLLGGRRLVPGRRGERYLIGHPVDQQSLGPAALAVWAVGDGVGAKPAS